LKGRFFWDSDAETVLARKYGPHLEAADELHGSSGSGRGAIGGRGYGQLGSFQVHDLALTLSTHAVPMVACSMHITATPMCSDGRGRLQLHHQDRRALGGSEAT
jgi:hypothetical protein